VASFAEQYSIRLECEDIAWPEYCKLFSGLSAETPIGRIIAIRSEQDQNVIQHWNADQKRIRRDWMNRKQSGEDGMKQVERLEKILAAAFGGGKGGKKKHV